MIAKSLFQYSIEHDIAKDFIIGNYVCKNLSISPKGIWLKLIAHNLNQRQ